ncbi:TIGR01620 family protein [Breoghania sp.]|uniref:YcjF family protein n=1 Tax=Breoghania sp. TaxID=2065378 RepID=UPI00262DCA05|nr:TIGR01620 family protein [Breoghania sp.]MDJ0932121.1 TIGR01620 family protein [Breoghania sp.]
MRDEPTRRAPRAFHVDGNRIVEDEAPREEPGHAQTSHARRRVAAEIVPEPALPEEEILPAPMPKRRATHWGRWLAVGLGGLISLAVGLAVDNLIRDLFTRTDWLGWTGIALAALAVLAVLAIILREIAGLSRLKQIDRLRQKFAAAAEADDRKTAGAALKELTALYPARPETARGRSAMTAHTREIIDGRDLVILTERELLSPLDAQARNLVGNASKRVSVVTAISPRAIVDLLVVGIENLQLIRALSQLYGGRPGTLGIFRLVRHVFAHLAVTGGMAAGDSLLQQVLGQGLAARVSARLGEGVINGLLTARIGAAAIDVCRPVPFIGTQAPRVTDFVSSLRKAADTVEEKEVRTD